MSAPTDPIVINDGFQTRIITQTLNGETEQIIPNAGTEAANERDSKQQLLDARQAARDRIAAARTSKAAATTAKQMSLTTFPEARSKVNALCDVVNDLAQELIDTNQALLAVLRYTLNDFETPPE